MNVMAHRTIKLTLEYDGTDFVGWQSQENGRSVQEVVEKGLSQILQEEIRVVGAGRTDSGVHAKGQIASFRIESSLNCTLIVRGLNGILPKDIVALHGEETADGFNARFDARTRRYEYVIKSKPTAISRNFSWVVGYKLDIERMKPCLDEIIGLHDFESFCKSNSEVSHHNCNVVNASWLQRGESTLVFDITANRFLHGMVRALVGTMVEIGRAYRPVDDLKRIMAAKDRREAGMAAPPRGLFLTEVTY
jgi:tRNA pseudouridine38-40 synthase